MDNTTTTEIPKSRQRSEELNGRNRRLALILGGLVLFVLITSVPFWLGISKIIGNQAG